MRSLLWILVATPAVAREDAAFLARVDGALVQLQTWTAIERAADETASGLGFQGEFALGWAFEALELRFIMPSYSRVPSLDSGSGDAAVRFLGGGLGLTGVVQGVAVDLDLLVVEGLVSRSGYPDRDSDLALAPRARLGYRLAPDEHFATSFQVGVMWFRAEDDEWKEVEVDHLLVTVGLGLMVFGP